MKRKAIYTTLIKEDADHIRNLLDESGFKSEVSSSLLNNHIYLNASSANEYTIFVEELYFIDAKFLLEKHDIEVIDHTKITESKREVDYLHDSLRLAIFGMLVVPLVLNILSIYKLILAVTHREKLKFTRIILILILNSIGFAFWSKILYDKYLL